MMHPIKRIRLKVFGLKQDEFALLAGVTQGTVSRWERGDLEPNRVQLAKIRDAAAARGLSLSDSWFFESDALLRTAAA